MNLHPVSLLVLAFISLSCLYERTYGLTAKFIPEYKRAESNYKWFKIDKSVLPNNEESSPEFVGYNQLARFQDTPQQTVGLVETENIPLPLALKMLHDKRGFDFGTGRSYTGFQAMRGNLGLAFASPGSHGK